MNKTFISYYVKFWHKYSVKTFYTHFRVSRLHLHKSGKHDKTILHMTIGASIPIRATQCFNKHCVIGFPTSQDGVSKPEKVYNNELGFFCGQHAKNLSIYYPPRVFMKHTTWMIWSNSSSYYIKHKFLSEILMRDRFFRYACTCTFLTFAAAHYNAS